MKHPLNLWWPNDWYIMKPAESVETERKKETVYLYYHRDRRIPTTLLIVQFYLFLGGLFTGRVSQPMLLKMTILIMAVAIHFSIPKFRLFRIREGVQVLGCSFCLYNGLCQSYFVIRGITSVRVLRHPYVWSPRRFRSQLFLRPNGLRPDCDLVPEVTQTVCFRLIRLL